MITGAGGFIGSRLSNYLRNDHRFAETLNLFDIIRNKVKQYFDDAGAAGHNGADNNNSDLHHVLDIDLSNHDAVDRMIHDVRPDIIIHTAALTSQSGHSPQMIQSQNLDNANALLCSLRQAVKDDKSYSPALIFSSSVAVYGHPQDSNGYVYEDDIPAPQNAYAQSKVDFENTLKGQDDVRYAILRYGNIPGKDNFMRSVIQNKTAAFYGDEPYVRDYIHLDDLNSLHVKVIEYLCAGGQSLTLNAGSGVGVTFTDLVSEIEKQTAETIHVSRLPAKENDVIRLICDMQRAKDILNWQPQKTSITDIVSYALENMQRHPETFS
jgi:UDP-glucose 4-epimerase